MRKKKVLSCKFGAKLALNRWTTCSIAPMAFFFSESPCLTLIYFTTSWHPNSLIWVWSGAPDSLFSLCGFGEWFISKIGLIFPGFSAFVALSPNTQGTGPSSVPWFGEAPAIWASGTVWLPPALCRGIGPSAGVPLSPNQHFSPRDCICNFMPMPDMQIWSKESI